MLVLIIKIMTIKIIIRTQSKVSWLLSLAIRGCFCEATAITHGLYHHQYHQIIGSTNQVIHDQDHTPYNP